MKKNIKLLTFAIISYFLIMGSINAASLSLSKSSSTVSVGSTVKITAKISGGTSYTYSNFSISYDQDRFAFVSSSDNCNGLNCLVEGNGSVTLTFKAKSNGSGSFRASGSFEDDNSGSLSGSTSVTVGASNTTTTPNEGKTLSSNNYLSSLKVENQTLTPEFNKDTLEYSLNLPSDTESINIIADKEDKKANIIGAGEVKVSEGINTLEIIVTAENGNKKTYVIKATVEEKDPIKVSLNKQTYTVVRNKDLLTKPENYEEKTIIIDGKETPAFYNEITKFTLVGLKDEKGNINLYIYDQNKKTYTLYKEMKFNNINLYPLSINKNIKGYKKYEIKINDLNVKVLKIKKDSKFAIVYGIDLDTGKKNYYSYDIENNTIQLYNDEYSNFLIDYMYIGIYIILGSWALLLIFIIIIIVLCVKNSKRKKKIRNILSKLSNSEIKDNELPETEKIAEEVIENSKEDEMYKLFDD
ncbi:MAG TPA: cadherin-like beta sandwich domain-containing protein [Bacilli bacterium]|nr:cadherin-like beta sandwich domain-containing protein [Bacilli bacterium]